MAAHLSLVASLFRLFVSVQQSFGKSEESCLEFRRVLSFDPSLAQENAINNARQLPLMELLTCNTPED